MGCSMKFKKLILINVAVVTAITILTFALIYRYGGFTFNFLSEYKNNLEVLYYVAGDLGLILNPLSIILAIWIPTRIAKSQKNISLFEKRWELYESYNTLYSLVKLYERELNKISIKSVSNICEMIKNCDMSMAKGNNIYDDNFLLINIELTIEKTKVLLNVNKLPHYKEPYNKFMELHEYIKSFELSKDSGDRDERLNTLIVDFINSAGYLKETLLEIENHINIEK